MSAVRFFVVSCVGVAIAILAASSSATAANDAGAPSALPACLSVSTQARYVPYGYNHVVILRNGCSKSARCNVATDVNPQPTVVDVAPAASVEVLTFAGSPAQTFTARVTCALH